MNLCGADISTRSVDLVFLNLDNDEAVWKYVAIADKRGGFYAARNVRPALGRLGLLGGAWDDTTCLYIEDPMSRNMGTVKSLALVVGALLACVPPAVTVKHTRPKEWQQAFLGEHMVRPKPAVAAKATELIRAAYPDSSFVDRVSYWSQDALEAYAIAFVGRELMDRAAKDQAA